MRLGAEGVLADRLQHAAERRVHDAQHAAGTAPRRRRRRQVVGDDPAVDARRRGQRCSTSRKPARSSARHAVVEAVLAAGEPSKLRGQDREGAGHRERDHGEEDRAHAQREQADHQRQQRPSASAERRAEPRSPSSSGPIACSAMRDAIGADAEEHGVGEGDDAGVAEQQVVARRQHDEDADLAPPRSSDCAPGNRNGATARPTSDDRRAPATRMRLRGRSSERSRRSIVSALRHADRGPAAATAGSATISRMLEPSATLGARKPM